jgi:hypothetical protein
LTSLATEGGVTFFCQAAAAVVQNIDCEDFTGQNLPYNNANSSFVLATTGPVNLLVANSRRTQFFVQNTSAADMIIKLGDGASLAGPTPLGSIFLPGGSLGIYESPLNGYAGLVTAAWRTGGSGGAIVTEGIR